MMLDKPLNDARAWTALTVDEPASWHHALDADCLTELDTLGVQDETRVADGSVADIRVHGRLPACTRCLQPALDALEQCRGFIIIDRPSASWTPQQQIVAYWMLGQVFGSPFEQDVAGTLLFDVHHTGRSVTEGGPVFCHQRGEFLPHRQCVQSPSTRLRRIVVSADGQGGG